MSQFMTLKQRRRHRELADEINRLKSKLPPFDYESGQDPEQEEIYREVIDQFQKVVEEMHELEEAVKHSH